MKNTGAAFSMMSDASPVLFVLLGVGVSVGILLWLRRHPRDQHLVAIALSLIMGGALGNVIDRVTRGYVVDFVDFYVGSWHFAAFKDRKRVGSGQSVAVRVDIGGRRSITKKKK